MNRLRSVAGFIRRVLAFARMYVASFRARFRTKAHYVVETIDGEAPVGQMSLESCTRAAIYMHFDAQGRVHRFVLHQLAELKQLGFTVVFVTNSPLLTKASLAALRPLVAKVMRRENVGYDFGAYKDAILSLGDVSRFDQLLLMNDSVYGPFQPLEEVLTDKRLEGADVVSMTDSWEVKYHLQSYFLLFKKPAIMHPWFLDFWKNLRYVDNKQYVIRQYEVGLTQLLLAADLNCRALYPYEAASKLAFDEVKKLDMHTEAFYALSKPHQDYYRFLKESLDFGRPVNGSHFFWQLMMSQMRYPYIKRELLTKNPMSVPGLIGLNDIIAELGTYDVTMISEHLQVLNRNRAP